MEQLSTPNLKDTLNELIDEADGDIARSDKPSAELLSDLEEVRVTIEDAFSEWEAPADSIAYAIDELDENFQFAGEEFLRVCDLIEEALVGRDNRILDDASRNMRKARILLKAAETAAAERFANWARRSQGPKFGA